MTRALISEWQRRTRAAREWRAGDDPEPVLDALAMTLALEVTGTLGRVAASERDALRKLGQRALLHVGGRDLDEDDLEALRMAAAVARDGLRALSGRPADADLDQRVGGEHEALRAGGGARGEIPAPDVRVIIAPGDLPRLLSGQLDGFSAGALAMRIRRSPRAHGELAMLMRQRADASGELAPRLALAAAEAEAVLDPAAGRSVGALEALGVEAILFEGAPRRLAVYAEDAAPLRLVAPELTTEDVREGYWIGRVAEGAVRLEATLQVGDQAMAWSLDLA